MDFWTKSAQLWWLLTFEPVDGFSNFKKVNWSEFRALSIGIITWIRLDPDPDPPKCLYLDPDPDPPQKKFGSKTLVKNPSTRGSKVMWVFVMGPKFFTQKNNLQLLWWCFSYFWRWNQPKFGFLDKKCPTLMAKKFWTSGWIFICKKS